MEAALADYFDRLDRGERADVSELAALYPGCETELRRFLSHERKLRGAVAVGAPSPEEGGVGTAPRDNLVGRTLGDFCLRRVIGRGGMGIVWEAEQLSLGRRVAVKLLPSGLCDDPRHRLRFHNEARILAQLEHPNIVSVIAVGEEPDAYFFAMQYIDGITVDDLIRIWGNEAPNTDAETRLGAALVDTDADDQPPPVNTPLSGESLLWISLAAERHERYNTSARIAAEVADGLMHAHECGVLHRDVKPSNVLLDKNGVARLSDFGLARMYGNATLTATGTMLGTLRYASPEQLRGTPTALDERSDVYSLGVMLWEMVAGKRLFEAEDRNSIISQVLNVEAPRPSSLEAKVPRDLETVIARALAKEPADRYVSARDFGGDLRRYLGGRPIKAQPISLAERTFRWANRNRVFATSAVGSLVVLAAVALLASGLVWRANSRTTAALRTSQTNEDRARQSAVAAQASARGSRELLYAADMSLAGAAWNKNEPAQVKMLLDGYRDDSSPADDPRGFEWYFLDRQTRRQSELLFLNDEALYLIQFVGDGGQFLTAGKDANVRWHDSATGKVVRSLETGQKEVNCVSYNLSETIIATTSDDGTLKIWDAITLSLLHSIKAYNGICYFAKFLNDELVLTGGESEVHRLFNAASGELVREYESPDANLTVNQSPTSWDAHVGRSGEHFWTASGAASGIDEGVYEWDVAKGESRRICKESEICRVLADRSEQFLFINSIDGNVRVLDVESGAERWSTRLDNSLEALALSPDESRIAAGDRNGQVYLWNLDLGNPEAVVTSKTPEKFSVHDRDVYSIVFSPDGKSLLTASRDGSVRRTPFEAPTEAFREIAWMSKKTDCAAVPGTNLAVVTGPLEVHDRSVGKLIRTLSPDSYQAVAVSSDGTLAAAGSATRVDVWSLATGERKLRVDQQRRSTRSLDFSSDNSLLAVWSNEAHSSRTDVVEIATGKSVRYTDPENSSQGAYFCAGDGLIELCSTPYQLTFWTIPDRDIRWQTKPMDTRISRAAPSPDGKLLLAAQRRALQLIDCATGAVRYEVPVDYSIESVVFLGDGRSFVIAGREGQISIWNTGTGQRLFEIANIGTAIKSIRSLKNGFMVLTSRVKEGRTELVWLEF